MFSIQAAKSIDQGKDLPNGCKKHGLHHGKIHLSVHIPINSSSTETGVKFRGQSEKKKKKERKFHSRPKGMQKGCSTGKLV